MQIMVQVGLSYHADRGTSARAVSWACKHTYLCAVPVQQQRLHVVRVPFQLHELCAGSWIPHS